MGKCPRPSISPTRLSLLIYLHICAPLSQKPTNNELLLWPKQIEPYRSISSSWTKCLIHSEFRMLVVLLILFKCITLYVLAEHVEDFTSFLNLMYLVVRKVTVKFSSFSDIFAFSFIRFTSGSVTPQQHTVWGMEQNLLANALTVCV